MLHPVYYILILIHYILILIPYNLDLIPYTFHPHALPTHPQQQSLGEYSRTREESVSFSRCNS